MCVCMCVRKSAAESAQEASIIGFQLSYCPKVMAKNPLSLPTPGNSHTITLNKRNAQTEYHEFCAAIFHSTGVTAARIRTAFAPASIMQRKLRIRSVVQPKLAAYNRQWNWESFVAKCEMRVWLLYCNTALGSVIRTA